MAASPNGWLANGLVGNALPCARIRVVVVVSSRSNVRSEDDVGIAWTEEGQTALRCASLATFVMNTMPLDRYRKWRQRDRMVLANGLVFDNLDERGTENTVRA